MKKTISILVLVTLVIIAGVMFRKHNSTSKLPVLSYGTFMFAPLNGNGQSITYPLIFTDITSDVNTVAFRAPLINTFDVFIEVTKEPTTKAEKDKTELISRSWVSEGSRTTRNGYVGEVLSADSKAHPIAGEKDCGISYLYTIPLADKSNSLNVLIEISDPKWGSNGNSNDCTLWNDTNYLYFKEMIKNVFDGVEPRN